MGIETRLTRLNATISVLEMALAAVIDHAPNKELIVAAIKRQAYLNSELGLAENFSDEELSAFQVAQDQFLSLISIGKSQ